MTRQLVGRKRPFTFFAAAAAAGASGWHRPVFANTAAAAAAAADLEASSMPVALAAYVAVGPAAAAADFEATECSMPLQFPPGLLFPFPLRSRSRL